MTSREYNLWTLTELHRDDPRTWLDVLIINAAHDNVKAMQYKSNKVFVISEKQYKKLQNSNC